MRKKKTKLETMDDDNDDMNENLDDDRNDDPFHNESKDIEAQSRYSYGV